MIKYLEKYKSRFTRQEQVVYENSCDCLYYGYGFQYLNCCGLPEARAKEIWNMAKTAMAAERN